MLIKKITIFIKDFISASFQLRTNKISLVAAIAFVLNIEIRK